MVLQRKAPLKIWGFGASSAGHLALSVTIGKLESAAKITEPGGDRWEATFPAQEASDPSKGLEVALLQAGQPVQTLEDVCFGDVFLFTGTFLLSVALNDQVWSLYNRLSAYDSLHVFYFSHLCARLTRQTKKTHA